MRIHRAARFRLLLTLLLLFSPKLFAQKNVRDLNATEKGNVERAANLIGNVGKDESKLADDTEKLLKAAEDNHKVPNGVDPKTVREQMKQLHEEEDGWKAVADNIRQLVKDGKIKSGDLSDQDAKAVTESGKQIVIDGRYMDSWDMDPEDPASGLGKFQELANLGEILVHEKTHYAIVIKGEVLLERAFFQHLFGENPLEWRPYISGIHFLASLYKYTARGGGKKKDEKLKLLQKMIEQALKTFGEAGGKTGQEFAEQLRQLFRQIGILSLAPQHAEKGAELSFWALAGADAAAAELAAIRVPEPPAASFARYAGQPQMFLTGTVYAQESSLATVRGTSSSLEGTVVEVTVPGQVTRLTLDERGQARVDWDRVAGGITTATDAVVKVLTATGQTLAQARTRIQPGAPPLTFGAPPQLLDPPPALANGSTVELHGANFGPQARAFIGDRALETLAASSNEVVSFVDAPVGESTLAVATLDGSSQPVPVRIYSVSLGASRTTLARGETVQGWVEYQGMRGARLSLYNRTPDVARLQLATPVSGAVTRGQHVAMAITQDSGRLDFTLTGVQGSPTGLPFRIDSAVEFGLSPTPTARDAIAALAMDLGSVAATFTTAPLSQREFDQLAQRMAQIAQQDSNWSAGGDSKKPKQEEQDVQQILARLREFQKTATEAAQRQAIAQAIQQAYEAAAKAAIDNLR